MRPAPYVFVFNMSSATLWRQQPWSDGTLLCSIVVDPDERLV
jgi:hypothetical protein